MSNFDPAFAGHCSCGNPCYGQSTCDTCDAAAEMESREEEEKIYCYVCEDNEVKDEHSMCGVCKEEAEEAWADAQKEQKLCDAIEEEEK